MRDRTGRQAERLRDPRWRVAEEFLSAGTADPVGGVRDPQGRQRLLHSDHDGSGRLGRPLRRHAFRGGELGEGEPRRPPRYGRRLLRLDDCISALLRVRRRIEERAPHAEGARAQAQGARRRARERSESRSGADTSNQAQGIAGEGGRRPGVRFGSCQRRHGRL